MKVSDTYVHTSSATTITGKACADIKSGDTVEGVGTKQTDGSVLATRMAVTAAPPVTFSGTIEASSGTCPVVTMKVSGTYVHTSSATTITGKACADIKAGDSVEGVGTKQTDGSVLATRMAVTAAPPVTFSGTVEGASGTCPVVTMKVSGTYVHTTSATTITGKACADIKSGDTVEGVGTKQTDGSVLATRMAVTAAPPVTFSGTVEGASGTCPVVTMKVSGTYVHTSSATTITGKACADIKSGDTVEGVGNKQTDGSVLATRMAVTAAPPVTFSGTIEASSGTCPVVTMKVSGTYVHTTSATTITGKACADIKSGDTVEGVGTKQTDGSVLATRMAVTAAPPVTFSGTVEGASGTCPVVTMKVSGTYVHTSSATTITGKACADIKSGDTVEGVGTKQTDGSVLATTLKAGK